MRLFYKASGFAEGKNVTAFFIDPDLQQSPTIGLKEYGGGIYYFDYEFCKNGPYCGKFFENGTPVIAQVFRKGKFPGIIEYK